MKVRSTFVDAQHRLLAAEELFRGTLARTSVHPREVVKRALEVNAAAVVFAHNHPRGVAEPSRADELLTAALTSALALVACARSTVSSWPVPGSTRSRRTASCDGLGEMTDHGR